MKKNKEQPASNKIYWFLIKKKIVYKIPKKTSLGIEISAKKFMYILRDLRNISISCTKFSSYD